MIFRSCQYDSKLTKSEENAVSSWLFV